MSERTTIQVYQDYNAHIKPQLICVTLGVSATDTDRVSRALNRIGTTSAADTHLGTGEKHTRPVTFDLSVISF